MHPVHRSFLAQLPLHERRRLEELDADAEDLARRRLAGEPLQYLEGTAPFVDFEVVVDERVLIPRPETEGLYAVAVGAVESPRLIVDLGTGSGVIAIALARRFPKADIVGVDVSADALSVAEVNAKRLGVRIDFRLGNLFAALPPRLRGRVDLLVSNPPYVAAPEWEGLPTDVRHEPRVALVAGPRGVEVLEAIAGGASNWLAGGGAVVCEMGETQAGQVREAFKAVGPTDVRDDLAGRPRYVIARRLP